MKDKDHYNNFYELSAEYKLHYKDFRYLPLFKSVLSKLNKQDRILELGCGVGHLAHLLKDSGFNNYIGVDFSGIAIRQANKRINQMFIKQDILKEELNYDYDVIIATEVFEHLYYEKVLNKLNKGSQIIFSVPNFLIDSHLYSWNNEQEIKKDFEKYIDIASIDIPLTHKNNKWFLINGFVK